MPYGNGHACINHAAAAMAASQNAIMASQNFTRAPCASAAGIATRHAPGSGRASLGIANDWASSPGTSRTAPNGALRRGLSPRADFYYTRDDGADRLPVGTCRHA